MRLLKLLLLILVVCAAGPAVAGPFEDGLAAHNRADYGTGSVAGRNGSLLLGQSFLGRFKSWSIDNTKHALVLE